MGRSNTFTPSCSAKVSVTGMEPPSLVRSGSRPYIAYGKRKNISESIVVSSIPFVAKRKRGASMEASGVPE